MNTQTAGWLVFLALIKTTLCDQLNPFELEESELTAKEGSCIEIKCKVRNKVSDDGAYWFWMKDAIYNYTTKEFIATVIYSTNESERAASKDFAHRVKYTGSPFSEWRFANSGSPQMCNILICNLKKTDSGQYFFRYVNTPPNQWVTQNYVTLTVAGNPCLITFEKPPAVKDSNEIILTCSTLSSCSSNLQIEVWPQLYSKQTDKQNQTHKSITVNFTADWTDDGKQFSCKTQNNTDTHLIHNITISVEYAPKNISATTSSKDIKETDTLTLTCVAKGVPKPTFAWYKKDAQEKQSTEAEWTIASITESQHGEYYCEATNKYGTMTSTSVSIDVKYAPSVEIKMAFSKLQITEGDYMNLTCDVKRSNPKPNSYCWLINGTQVHESATPTYVVDRVQPEDSGFYTCTATNTVGRAESRPFSVQVQYHPRNTKITESDKQVKVGKSLKFTCYTEAYPGAVKYSWYRYDVMLINSSHWMSTTTSANVLHLSSVNITDKACYTCNATNEIGTGPNSDPVCIDVLYPPTRPVLSMAEVITEGQTINITCTAESYPSPSLTLTRTNELNSQSPQWHLILLGSYGVYAFNVTSDDAGFYTCNAENSEGSSKSRERKLVVKYSPKVKVQVHPGLVVNENTSLTLVCSAQSYPQVDSFTWMKTTDGKKEEAGTTKNFTVKSVKPSDRGEYSCAARNEIGTGRSLQVEIKVNYAPKHTNIIVAAEQQEPDGRRFVTLSCSTQCYPPDIKYFWYKNKNEVDIEVSTDQNYTVYSDQPGIYYCVARNALDEKSSEPVILFDRGFLKYLLFFLIFILIIVFIAFLVYRRRRKNTVQRATQPLFGFLDWSTGGRRGHLIHETALAEPFRSRDDLLPDQPCRPGGQRSQPCPDSTPASNISSVYSTVNLPTRKQAPSAQNPTRPQGGDTADDSLNYASLHFDDKQKKKLPKEAEDVVYVKVSKPKPFVKNEQELLKDYENLDAACADKCPNPSDDDTDSSEDDVHVNYSQVSFTANPGQQRASRDSSSSDEDDIQYSDIKF